MAAMGIDRKMPTIPNILPMMMILDIDGIGHDVEDPDDIPIWCQTHRVPMGANVHLVFFRSKKSPKVLFKVLLNGEEAHLPIETDNWPYYDWEAFKARYGR